MLQQLRIDRAIHVQVWPSCTAQARPVPWSCTPVGSELPCDALQMANAYAKSVAYTFIYYYQFVCTCCKGNNLAYATVSADVQVPFCLKLEMQAPGSACAPVM